jgi:hypothetical protein
MDPRANSTPMYFDPRQGFRVSPIVEGVCINCEDNILGIVYLETKIEEPKQGLWSGANKIQIVTSNFFISKRENLLC